MSHLWVEHLPQRLPTFKSYLQLQIIGANVIKEMLVILSNNIAIL